MQQQDKRANQTLNILMNAGVYLNKNQKGIQRYFNNILPYLADRNASVSLWLDGPSATPLPQATQILEIGGSPAGRWNALRRLWAATDRFRSRESLESYDIYYSSFFQPPIKAHADLPEVCTVYDMIVENFPRLCGEWGKQQAEAKAKAIRRSCQIIAISNATANDLARFYPEVRDRVTVVHPGADHIRALKTDDANVCRALNLEGRFAIFVGERLQYKNFAQLLQAAHCKEWPGGLGLVVVGPEPTEDDRVRASCIESRIRFVGNVSEFDLAALIQAAEIAIVPSRLEGFGFPVVEAQRLGTPVLCSDIPVFREIAGKGAVYFPVETPRSLAEAASELFEDASLCDKLRELGFANSERFTWSKCADLIFNVLERASGVCPKLIADVSSLRA